MPVCVMFRSAEHTFKDSYWAKLVIGLHQTPTIIIPFKAGVFGEGQGEHILRKTIEEKLQ